jgi:hypothetical protein
MVFADGITPMNSAMCPVAMSPSAIVASRSPKTNE